MNFFERVLKHISDAKELLDEIESLTTEINEEFSELNFLNVKKMSKLVRILGLIESEIQLAREYATAMLNVK